MEKPHKLSGYVGCLYCKHVAVTILDPRHRVFEEYCSYKTGSDGQPSRITAFSDEVARMKEKGIESVDGFFDCESFESSGIVAHPDKRRALISANPKCQNIPSDPTVPYDYDLYDIIYSGIIVVGTYRPT